MTALVDQYPMPPVEKALQYPRFLYVSFALLGIIAVVSVCLLLLRPRPSASAGYLRTAEGEYVNVLDRLFPAHPSNFSMALTLSSLRDTFWWMEPTGAETFALKTELDGAVYSIQMGPPGTGAEWGVAFVAPSGAGPELLFTLTTQKNLQPVDSAWPYESRYWSQQDKQVFWSASPLREIKISLQ